jgi:hypothetical protein
VGAAEIVEREPASDSGPVLLPLFAEGVGEARETPIAYARAQVAALHNRSADTIRIRIAADWEHLHGLYFGARVSALAFGRCAINLNDSPEDDGRCEDVR